MPDTIPFEQVDWHNAETCIENMQIAYDDASEADPFGDGNPIPIDTVVDAGDLGVLIGLARYAVASRARTEADRSVREALENAQRDIGHIRDALPLRCGRNLRQLVLASLDRVRAALTRSNPAVNGGER